MRTALAQEWLLEITTSTSRTGRRACQAIGGREEPRVVVDGARQMLEKRRLSGRKGGRNAIRRDQRRKEACTRERLQQLRDHTF